MKKASFNSKLKRIFTFGLVLSLLISFSMAELDTDVPVGWAAVPSNVGMPPLDDNEVESTIGGGDGRLVNASGSEVAGYAQSSEPLVIMAEGSCGGFSVASNKTIIGVGEGLTIKGEVGLDGVSNVILRNLKISNGRDGIGISGGAHHLWIDHCDVSSCGDGLIDMKRGADKITISWTKLYDHNKVMLINNGGKTENDIGRLNVTLHHLWFYNSVQRHPRVGYGQVHIMNNYYVGCSSYAIHVYWNAEVVIERCYFTGVSDAISDHYRNQQQGDWPGPGYVVLIDNYTDVPGSIMKETTTDPDRIFNIDEFYMYDWVVTKDVKQVPEAVQLGAGTGPQWGKIGALPTPGNGYTRVNTNPTLKWTKVGSKESNKVCFGKSYPPPEVATVDGYSYKPGQLEEGTVYYWKINDGKVWKFRTEGEPVAVRPNPSILRKSASGPIIFQKGDPGRPTVLIGVQKGGKEKGLFDLKGKRHIQMDDPLNKKMRKAK